MKDILLMTIPLGIMFVAIVAQMEFGEAPVARPSQTLSDAWLWEQRCVSEKCVNAPIEATPAENDENELLRPHGNRQSRARTVAATPSKNVWLDLSLLYTVYFVTLCTARVTGRIPRWLAKGLLQAQNHNC